MRFGFIGCGNLGSSLVKGLLAQRALGPEQVMVSDVDPSKMEGLKGLGVRTTSRNRELAEVSDVIFIAVKPGEVGKVLEEIGELDPRKLLVSVAAGVSIGFLERRTRARVIRVMPNICCLVGQMASCFSAGERATEEDRALIKGLLGKLGETFEIKEELMDAVTGLSGSGPAYVYLLAKAMEEAGTELGLPKEISLRLAAQTIKGAGEMVLSSGRGLEELISMVCSPKGTTIEGLRVLEDRRVVQALKDAVKAAAKRAKELSR